MAQCNHAEMAQNGPVPKRAPPTDRFSLLPKELRDIIYSLVFQSDGGPWTVHIKSNPPQPFKHFGWYRLDPDLILSILALPRNRKYKALRREEPDEAWPDHLEEAFFRALDWACNHRQAEERMSQYYNETISEILYELTGIPRCRQKVPSLIQTLKDCVNKFKPESERILPEMSSSVSTLQNLDASNDIQEITKTITHIQSLLPKLQSAFQDEHEEAILIPPRPTLSDFSSSPIITIHDEVFRTLSAIVSDPHSDICLSLHPPKPSHLLSLTLVNHFHRTQTLPILASALVFDFGDNIKAIHRPQNPSLSLYIKRLNLLFVEGHMQIPLIEPLADCRPAHRVLPNLRKLSIEIWPRKPTRKNRGDMSWGEQTLMLLKTLEKFRGGAVRVVVGFRFESDCRRFEEGYVEWRRKRSMEVDGGVVERGAMCRRLYELKRN